MNLTKLHDKRVEVAFRTVVRQQQGEGFLTMPGVLTESAPDYICLTVDGGKDLYIPMDTVQWIAKDSEILRPRSPLIGA